MAGRGRTSFQKRQKEQVRLERRQQKAARKQERKAKKAAGVEDVENPESEIDFGGIDGNDQQDGNGQE